MLRLTGEQLAAARAAGIQIVGYGGFGGGGGGGGGGAGAPSGNMKHDRTQAHAWLVNHGFDGQWAASMINGPWKDNPWAMAQNHYNAHVSNYGRSPAEEKVFQEKKGQADRVRKQQLAMRMAHGPTQELSGTLERSGAMQGFRPGGKALDRKRKQNKLPADDLKIGMNISQTQALGINLA
tara:strand:- start:2525 stop:3064 length:540 start_codon:yes stop_codon:yes gene_type:complete